MKFKLFSTYVLLFSANLCSGYSVILSANTRNNNISDYFSDFKIKETRDIFVSGDTNNPSGRNKDSTSKQNKEAVFEDPYIKSIKNSKDYKNNRKFYERIILLRRRLAHEFAKDFNCPVKAGFAFICEMFRDEVAVSNIKRDKKDFSDLIYQYAETVNENNESLEYDYLKDRVEAIQKTVNSNYAVKHYSYTVQKEVEEYLIHNDILADKFRFCTGTILQQVLHIENLDILNQAYQLSKKPNYGDFCGHIAKFNSTSCDLNHHGKVNLSSKLNDFCMTALKYAKAISQGVVLGAENATAIILHPIDTLSGICSLGGAFCKLLYEIGYLDYCLESGDINGFIQKNNELNAKASSFYDSISDHVNKMEGPDIAKHTTAMIVDLILSKQVGKCVGNFANYAKGSVAKVVDKIRKKEQPIFAIEGLPAQLAIESTDILKMEIAAEKAAKTSFFFDRIHHAKQYLTPEAIKIFAELEHEVKFLYNRYKDIRIYVSDIAEPLKITREFIEHLLVPDIWLDYKSGKLKLSGFHHDLNNRLHSVGFLEQAVGNKFNNGFFDASVFLGDIKIKDINSFFPSNLSHIELFDKIIDSCKHLSQKPMLRKNGKWELIGNFMLDIDIQIMADVKGRLKTAYILKK